MYLLNESPFVDRMHFNKIRQFFDFRQLVERLYRLFSFFAHPFSFFENMGNWKKLLRLPMVGDGIVIKGKISIKNPEFIYLGSNVTLERGATLEGKGGIVVCNDVAIGKNVSVYSDWNAETLTAKPLFLDTDLPATNLTKKQKTTALDKGENVFFILSTGRAGSTSIAAILNQHPDIACLHEPNRLLIRLSTEYAHGIKTREEVKQELHYYYGKTSLFPGVIYGESDHKLFNLAEILSALLPKARFIWLIRHARDFVASVYGRHWFDEPYLQQRLSQANLIEQQLIRYRINGYHCGEFTEETWNAMDQFEKVCWYWLYYNRVMEKQLQSLPAGRWRFIRLEEMNSNIAPLLEFLGVSPVPLKKKKKNKAYYERFTPDAWTREQKASYDKWCKEGMEKWYGSVNEKVH